MKFGTYNKQCNTDEMPWGYLMNAIRYYLRILKTELKHSTRNTIELKLYTLRRELLHRRLRS